MLVITMLAITELAIYNDEYLHICFLFLQFFFFYSVEHSKTLLVCVVRAWGNIKMNNTEVVTGKALWQINVNDIIYM